MKIGKYKLFSIETSEFSLDGGAMFGIIPKVMWEKQAPSDSSNRYGRTYDCRSTVES